MKSSYTLSELANHSRKRDRILVRNLLAFPGYYASKCHATMQDYVAKMEGTELEKKRLFEVYYKYI